MVNRSPAERYLKFLIVRHDRYTDKQIVDVAQRQGLDVLGGYYIAELRKKLVPPVPFYPENKRHPPSFRFLLSKDLYPFYFPDIHMTEAFRLLEQPKSKELIETMLLSAAPFQWIVTALRREGYKASIESIKQFKISFFDVDKVDDLEMRTLMRARFHASGTTMDLDRARLEALYEKEAWADGRVAAAAAPIKNLATMMSAVRIGLLPSNADYARLLTAARTLAAVRSIEATMRNGRDDHERAAAFMSVSSTANAILESVGSPEEDLQSKLAAIQLQTEEDELPMLDAVTSGIHTEEIEKVGGVHADQRIPGATHEVVDGGDAAGADTEGFGEGGIGP